ncbi:hypothetical protein CERSUDRAFT_60339 [Gelatoporia subvermispora B]|uniref:SET domain-containing protein n=1 Tax=Ceriporiopsis subvermispora (strain B) TaxID=914234 RepID=M2Q374_CERS8|nr:hypothetical protein CERSUDRAFT_60339 [Gelatoporia subvermispora B]
MDPVQQSSSTNPEQYRLTSLPATYFDPAKNDPDGWTECILRPGMKEALLAQPGFPIRVPRPSSPAHRIGPIDGAGLGMFATRAIEAGDLIFAERPLLLGPGAWTYVLERDPGTDRMDMLFREWEEYMKVAVDRMDPAKQAAYRALSNAHLDDGSLPLVGILRTNGFSVTGVLRKVVPDLPKGEIHELTAIGEVLSRVNHSCRPNAHVRMDTHSLSLQLVALRPIASGEQVTVAYTDILAPYTTRKRKLAPYGFTCSCLSCADPVRSDRRRRTLALARRVLHREDFTVWLHPASGLSDEHMSGLLEEVREKIEAEGLWDTPMYAEYLMRMRDMYAALGKREELEKAALRVLEYASAHEGYIEPLVRKSAAIVHGHPGNCEFWDVRAKFRENPPPVDESLSEEELERMYKSKQDKEESDEKKEPDEKQQDQVKTDEGQEEGIQKQEQDNAQQQNLEQEAKTAMETTPTV